MYTVSDVIDMGEAHELVQSQIKLELTLDDWSPRTMPAEEYFDQ